MSNIYFSDTCRLVPKGRYWEMQEWRQEGKGGKPLKNKGWRSMGKYPSNISLAFTIWMERRLQEEEGDISFGDVPEKVRTMVKEVEMKLSKPF